MLNLSFSFHILTYLLISHYHNVYTTINKKITNIINNANQRELQAEEDLNPSNIDKVTKELSSTYEDNNKNLTSLENKVNEIKTLITNAKDNSNKYYSAHSHLSDINDDIIKSY